MTFHWTHHMVRRVAQRSVRREHAMNVVKYGTVIQELGRGTHGGRRRKYSKTDSGRTIVVVAETKANDCWLITAYYAN